MFSAIWMRMVVSPVEKMSPDCVKVYAAKKNAKTAARSVSARIRDGARLG
jgi:hypothetical protein